MKKALTLGWQKKIICARISISRSGIFHYIVSSYCYCCLYTGAGEIFIFIFFLSEITWLMYYSFICNICEFVSHNSIKFCRATFSCKGKRSLLFYVVPFCPPFFLWNLIFMLFNFFVSFFFLTKKLKAKKSDLFITLISKWSLKALP
jgi:hypothetical protein